MFNTPLDNNTQQEKIRIARNNKNKTQIKRLKRKPKTSLLFSGVSTRAVQNSQILECHSHIPYITYNKSGKTYEICLLGTGIFH